MANTGDYILVHMVDEIEVGKQFLRSRMAWPLHITLVPWFNMPNIDQLQKELAVVAEQIKPFDAEMGEATALGPNKDIPVNLVANPEPLQSLQALLIQAVKTSGGLVESEWIGDAYRPHVTHHGERRLEQGVHEFIGDIHLVQVGDERMCTVVNRYKLGQVQS